MKVQRFTTWVPQAIGGSMLAPAVPAEDFDRVEAERDALQALLNERDELTDAYSAAIAASNELGYACMAAASVIHRQAEQLSSAREFVRNLVKSSGGQGSVAAGYLSDILERLL